MLNLLPSNRGRTIALKLRRQRERQKRTLGLISKQQLSTCITLFCTFFAVLAQLRREFV